MSDVERPETKPPGGSDAPIETRAVGWRPTGQVGLQAVVLSGNHKGHSVVLGGHTRIGKSSDNDIVLTDDTVSRHHCELLRAPDGIHVRDLESTNGTRVDGTRIREAVLGSGQVLKVGEVEISIRPTQQRVELLPSDKTHFGSAIGQSLAMRTIFGVFERIAPTDATVLLEGETGTGKDVLARAIYQQSTRAKGPFIVVDCGAVSYSLIESELFGHERGAYTGAVSARQGAFELADNGTVFLDEIGELPLEAQPKLLRALDGYEVRGVGVTGSGARADVRVVAATHVALEREVTERRFRLDLFHRLEAFVINVPPLRERRGDVGGIARTLLLGLTANFGKRELTPDAISRLALHDWPGNVRELRNILLRACDESTDVIDSEHIARVLGERLSRRAAKATTVEEAEAMLARRGGNVSAAARACGMPRSSFRKLLESGRTKR
jgi:transcriptional regulator with GAF, ATPase, and Fis domain